MAASGIVVGAAVVVGSVVTAVSLGSVSGVDVVDEPQATIVREVIRPMAKEVVRFMTQNLSHVPFRALLRTWLGYRPHFTGRLEALLQSAESDGDVAEWFRQGPAKPCTWVRFPASPPMINAPALKSSITNRGTGGVIRPWICPDFRAGQEVNPAWGRPHPASIAKTLLTMLSLEFSCLTFIRSYIRTN